MVRVVSQNFSPPRSRHSSGETDRDLAERANAALSSLGRKRFEISEYESSSDSFWDSELDDTLVSEGGENSNDINGNENVEKSEVQIKRKERRRERNKLSAQAYRQRRRYQNVKEQQQLMQLEAENKRLHKLVEALEKKTEDARQLLRGHSVPMPEPMGATGGSCPMTPLSYENNVEKMPNKNTQSACPAYVSQLDYNHHPPFNPNSMKKLNIDSFKSVPVPLFSNPNPVSVNPPNQDSPPVLFIPVGNKNQSIEKNLNSNTFKTFKPLSKPLMNQDGPSPLNLCSAPTCKDDTRISPWWNVSSESVFSVNMESCNNINFNNGHCNAALEVGFTNDANGNNNCDEKFILDPSTNANLVTLNLNQTTAESCFQKCQELENNPHKLMSPSLQYNVAPAEQVMTVSVK